MKIWNFWFKHLQDNSIFKYFLKHAYYDVYTAHIM